MGLGDYVWFRMVDDAVARKEFRMVLSTDYRAGKIIKWTKTTNPQLFWVTILPIEGEREMPLWAIPVDLVKEMTNEDAMLHILESQ